LRLLRAAVAAGIVLLVAYPALASRARAASLSFWILTLAGAPLALAALLRDRIDIRSAAAGSRPGRREATLGRFGRGSGPLPALVRTTLLPLFGREPTATVCFALVCVVVFGFLRSAGSALAPLEVFSPASVPLCLSLAMVAGVPWFSWAAKPDESLEHLLSQPLSRPLLAAGIGAALHFALCAFAGIGFAENLALARAFGSPEPSLVAAAAWLLLASAQVGISSAGLCRVLGTQSGRAFVAMLLSVLALPALVALPAIERGLRGDSALLSSWIRAEGAPWLAAHAPLALGALFVSAALAQALAYRRFRSLGL
jgi:hypothetical protein